MISIITKRSWIVIARSGFSRRGNLVALDFIKVEIASLRSQRQQMIICSLKSDLIL